LLNAIRLAGRDRLPACVVKMRSVLCFMRASLWRLARRAARCFALT
jgi:hypothetical protein